jgi:hypothetical protein
MKATVFLFFALGATSAFACANYKYCHCYSSGGAPDNAATVNVCNDWYGVPSGPTGVNGAQECSDLSGLGIMSNSDFRRLCTVAFATGGDSSCREKN